MAISCYLTATKPVPDDVMTLQAHHLTGEVMKGFRLTSLIIHAIGSPLLCTHKSMYLAVVTFS